jgi:hypothetical protein
MELLSATWVVIGTAATAAVVLPAPRSLTVTVTDHGWQKVVCRRSRQRRVGSTPQRLVPVDLTGCYFNCFVMTHFAARCQQRTQCFRCRALGHLLVTCPVRSGHRLFVPTKVVPTLTVVATIGPCSFQMDMEVQGLQKNQKLYLATLQIE